MPLPSSTPCGAKAFWASSKYFAWLPDAMALMNAATP